MSYNKALDRMMNLIRSRAPGATDTLIKDELYDALDEFFMDSNIWKETIPVTTVAGEDTYQLGSAEAGQIHRLMWVLDGNDIQVSATMEEPGVLVLATEPNSVQTLNATVTLTVTDPTTTDRFPIVPDWIADRWANHWKDGVLARLMSMPNKPFTNTQLAVYHAKKFSDTVGFARSEAQRMNTYKTQAWRFPQSFAVRRRG